MLKAMFLLAAGTLFLVWLKTRKPGAVWHRDEKGYWRE